MLCVPVAENRHALCGFSARITSFTSALSRWSRSSKAHSDYNPGAHSSSVIDVPGLMSHPCALLLSSAVRRYRYPSRERIKISA